ncbi:MAG: DNA polymerase [Promethearchaeia archaeon]
MLSALVDLHPLPAIVLEHRHITKMLTGFVVPLCERAIRAAERDGLSSIHTCWSQTSTATGRLSSSEPNLQNVPKQESVRFGTRTDLTKDMNVRTAFVPRANKILLSIDYVQCELRIMAHFSQDASLIGLLNGTECPYSGIAASVQRKHVSEVTPRERNIYKTVVLGMLYGQGQKSLATKLNMTESEAANTISRFFNCFPAVREFKVFHAY